uniref:Expressed+protein n=1 Tax=Oryza punctata TaxID=4537 RepID=G8JBG3_ORYPU|nr:expressed+protein [Oryza punctata]
MSCRLGMVALVLVGVMLAAILQEATVDAGAEASSSPPAKGYLDYDFLKSRKPKGAVIPQRPCIENLQCRG